MSRSNDFTTLTERLIETMRAAGPITPMALVDRFSAEADVDPVRVQSVMWSAVNDGALELTTDGSLVVPA